jgi:hypothetical protein
MLLNEIIRAFVRRGKTIKKVYRCTVGIRKGRAVSDPAQCFAPKKSASLRSKLRASAIRNSTKRKIKSKIARKKAIHFRLIRLNKTIKSRFS